MSEVSIHLHKMNPPGLIRKYFLLSEDSSTVGGVYLWKSQEKAEQLYSAEWRQAITDKYGTEPSVTYFASPVIVDNLAGSIITDDWCPSVIS